MGINFFRPGYFVDGYLPKLHRRSTSGCPESENNKSCCHKDGDTSIAQLLGVFSWGAG